MTEAEKTPAAPEPTAQATPEEAAPPTPQAKAAPSPKQETAPAKTEAVHNPDARIAALEDQATRFKRQRDELQAKLEGSKTVETRLAELEQANAELRARNVLRSEGIHDDDLVSALAPGVMSAEDPKAVAKALAEKLKPQAIIAPRAPSNGAPQPAAGWQARLR